MPSISELYRLYGKRVYNLAYRMMGDRTVAEDILQEVFIQVLQHSDSFRGESSIYTWIYAITKNLCLQTRKRSFLVFERMIEAAEAAGEKTHHDELERRDYVQQVKDGCLTGLLRCLSFHQRMVFILHVLYRVPANVVAGALRKSENSVRILASRAKANLKAFLCKNCSLYDAGNHCRCENMVGFSLRNKWISKSRFSPKTVEAELKELKNEVLLYRSLREHDPPGAAEARLLKRRDLKILSPTKVK